MGLGPYFRTAAGVAGLAAASCAAAPVPSSTATLAAVAQNEPVNLTRTYRRGERLELHTAYIQQPETSGDSRGFLGLKVKSKLGAELPLIQAEIDYGSFDPQSSLPLDNESHRSIWLGAQSAWHDIQYGVSYQSMGRDFVPLAPVITTAAPGTDRIDLWGQHRFGKLGVRTFAWRSADQSLPDNVGNRWANTAIGTAFNYVLLSAPHIDATLSYSRQLTTRIDQPDWIPTDDALSHNWFGSLSIRHPHWNATASSSYTFRADCSAAEGDPLGVWTQTISATYLPYPNVSVAPTFTYQDAPQDNHSRTKTRSATVALSFQPAGTSFMFTANGSLATQSNATWLADSTNFNTQAGITMPLPFGESERRKGTLALQLGYTETSDAYANNEDVMLHLDLTLHEFN